MSAKSEGIPAGIPVEADLSFTDVDGLQCKVIAQDPDDPGMWYVQRLSPDRRTNNIPRMSTGRITELVLADRARARNNKPARSNGKRASRSNDIGDRTAGARVPLYATQCVA